ncbi:hypothetical protein BDR03DRAFT_309604 [Suillus americanus]|nr:hypothetical protein BDR03DRAFT_309604 [Suillus americanus]
MCHSSAGASCRPTNHSQWGCYRARRRIPIWLMPFKFVLWSWIFGLRIRKHGFFNDGRRRISKDIARQGLEWLTSTHRLFCQSLADSQLTTNESCQHHMH